MGEFVFHILGAVAQLERGIIRERTLAGLAVAAENGNHPGRPRALTQDQIIWAYKAMENDGASFDDVAVNCAETLRQRVRDKPHAA